MDANASEWKGMAWESERTDTELQNEMERGAHGYRLAGGTVVSGEVGGGGGGGLIDCVFAKSACEASVLGAAGAAAAGAAAGEVAAARTAASAAAPVGGLGLLAFTGVPALALALALAPTGRRPKRFGVCGCGGG